jgi:hypothetical protein
MPFLSASVFVSVLSVPMCVSHVHDVCLCACVHAILTFCPLPQGVSTLATAAASLGRPSVHSLGTPAGPGGAVSSHPLADRLRLPVPLTAPPGEPALGLGTDPSPHSSTVHAPVHHARTHTPCTHPCTRHPVMHNARTHTPCMHPCTMHTLMHHARTHTPCTHSYTMHTPMHLARTQAPCTHSCTMHTPMHFARTQAPPHHTCLSLCPIHEPYCGATWFFVRAFRWHHLWPSAQTTRPQPV